MGVGERGGLQARGGLRAERRGVAGGWDLREECGMGEMVRGFCVFWGVGV